MGGVTKDVDGVVTVVEDGDVTVERRIHPSTRNGSFVTLVVGNTGEDPLAIHVEEALSEAVEHVAPVKRADRESSSWAFDGKRIVHEHVVAPGDKRAMIYEVRLDHGEVAPQLSQPTVVDVETVEALPGDGQADSDASGGALWRGGSTPAIAGDGSGTVQGQGNEPEEPAEAKSEETPPLVGRLVTELEAADEAELVSLREQLRPSPSERVRLEHFRSRVDDMEAYVEILETFLDDYGRPDDVVDGIPDRLAETETKLEDQGSRLDAVETEGREREREIQAAVRHFEEKVDRLDRQFDALESRVSEWQETQQRITNALAGERLDGERPGQSAE
jgi:archaellum component FlaC